MRTIAVFIFAVLSGQLAAQYYGHVYTPAVGGYDADYQAVLDEATAQGYSLPSASEQDDQNQFVVDAKAAGYWSDLDVFYLYAHDADKDFCRINWIDPTGTKATEEGTVTFTSDSGVKPSTATSGFDTGWATDDGPNLTASKGAIGTNVDSYTNNATTYYMWGDGNGTSASLARSRGDQTGIAQTGSTVFIVTNTLGEKHVAAVRDGGTLKLYIDGSEDSSANNSAGSTSTDNMGVLGWSTGTGIDDADTNRTYRYFFAGGLSPAEAGDLQDDMDTYLTTIGL